jgi:hypothetical protein
VRTRGVEPTDSVVALIRSPHAKTPSNFSSPVCARPEHQPEKQFPGHHRAKNQAAPEGEMRLSPTWRLRTASTTGGRDLEGAHRLHPSCLLTSSDGDRRSLHSDLHDAHLMFSTQDLNFSRSPQPGSWSEMHQHILLPVAQHIPQTDHLAWPPIANTRWLLSDGRFLMVRICLLLPV